MRRKKCYNLCKYFCAVRDAAQEGREEMSERKFILSCESTVDMPYSYIHGERGIPVTFYSYAVDGVSYEDDMGRDPKALPHFYEMLHAGKLPSTSQINYFQYEEFLEGLLQQGDVLHIAFGTGMTTSYNNARDAAEALQKKYPDRKIQVIDSYCSSSGYGMLVDYAADMRDAGCSLEETADWVRAHAMHIHHQFYSTELDFYRHSGRMSGTQAALATVLNICPIMRLDRTGHIKAYSKVRGRKAAIRTTLNEMEAHCENGKDYSGKCFICHSECLDAAEEAKKAVQERFPKIQGDVRICDIGTIIASHCGWGTVAVFFLGDERPEMD